MKVLAIGNSFSQDAMRYLHDIALADNVELLATNLYIGGCSLETHWNNALADEAAYSHEINGTSTDNMISIKEALTKEDWDFVTMQQASLFSFDYCTYQPYLKNLSDYVKQYAPGAKQLIHQTWAYEQGSEMLREVAGYQEQLKMFCDLKAAYNQAAADLGGLQIIPGGESFQIAIKKGITNIHRDTFHASLGFGRYLLGAVWYETLTGKSVMGNTFRNFEEAIAEEDVQLAQQCAHEAISQNKLG
jgi:hypothetical protein